jgi:hypothetical protein
MGKVAVIDDEDYPLIANYKWHASRSRYVWYAKSNVRNNGKKTTIQMHRVLLGLVPGDGVVVDHRDGDGLNNRKSNLRASTNAVNMQNKKHVAAMSGSMGVHKFRHKWRVNVMRDGKRYEVGVFDTIEAAAKAREAFLEDLAA